MNFDDWFYEQEGYHIRSERFWDDFDTRNRTFMLEWLKTSYQMGYEEGKRLCGENQ